MKLSQQTLDLCWSEVKLSQPRPSFLRLPPGIRRQIYIDAGFPSGCYIPFPTSRTEHIDYKTGALVLSLLLTCRTIYSETLQILLGDNVFTAVLKRPGDLSHLHQSTERIRAIRRLLIYVKSDEEQYQTLVCLHFGTALLSPSETQPACQEHTHKHMGETFLEFRQTLKFILANTQPGTLELGLMLYVYDDLELADWLLSPLLHKEAPPLADCAIYLGDKYKADKADLIHKYTTQSIIKPTNTTPSASFRFADLPLELRCLVLSFTDLVVPADKIEWVSPGAWSMHIDSNHELGCGHSDLNYGRFPNGSCLHHNFSCAFWTCGRSQYCRCWGPPTAILLCNRWLYNEALYVFFHMNCFVSMPDWADAFFQGEEPQATLAV